ncbi:hypothetical protein PC129_g3674 [Phytophthora cactorum]|uniref:Uncharacterized protein n=1 Tax=Phytophthora cactorum TaxID=29920 RepID=A0A8T1IK62_9STRA|nr:hypothetical protein PC114_g4903 [Phytophthora cactorum]KAG2949877.1 hypothetical protein PC117_g4890 [Phytophthora cactorum]KAG3225735.1 hypothetical protein PC129_g3674 [Phytophthora cactorum]KAG4251491.1 hypothetical protein PC116_g794 [Phytophthora cactorum]
MDTKRARKAAASPSSDTESDPQAEMEASSSSASPSSSSLGKRAQDEALASADAKKQRKDKPKSRKDQAESEALSETKDEAEQVAAVLTDAAQPIEMVITTEEAVGLNAAVAATAEPIQEQVAAPPLSKPRKGRRVRKTNLEKMEILAFVDQGGSQGAAAEKFGVSRTAVTKMWAATSKTSQQQGQNEAIHDVSSPVIEAFDVHGHTHMRNTLSWLHMAWESVPSSSIRHAWAASLYLSAPEPGDGEVNAALIAEEDSKAYAELLSHLTKVPALQNTLGLDFTENSGQFMLELLDFDKSESNGADELVKDNEIVVESLAAQGLLRDTQRALVLESFKSDDLPVLTANEANSTVSRLLHFMSQENDNLLTLSERRTGRANLLILQRLLLKARERERERESATDFTV